MIKKHIDGTGGFLCMSNSIFHDTDLSLKARGLLSTMLSLPDDWSFSVAGLAAIVPDGKAAITTALKELESAGYVARSQTREGCGHYCGVAWTISDVPEFKSPVSNDPVSNDPIPENRTPKDLISKSHAPEKQLQYNIHIQNKNESNKQEEKNGEQPVFDFPIIGGTFYIAQKDIDRWQDVFPGVDVVAELKKMRLWCEDNPTKRKSQSGARRFVSNWLNRANSDLQSRGKQRYENSSRNTDESEASIYDQFAGEVL